MSRDDRIEARHRLVPMQEGMLYHHLSEAGEEGVDVEQIVCRLREPLDRERFRAAWEEVARRHDALRSSFRWGGEEKTPLRQVHRGVELDFEVREVPADEEVGVRPFLDSDRARGFSLDSPPLFRVTLLRHGDASWTVVWSFAHILLDGPSLVFVLEEVFNWYDSAPGEEPEFEDRPPFERFVEWRLSRDPSQDEAFWSGYLEPVDAPTVIEGASGGVREDESRWGVLRRDLGEEPSRRLKALVSGERFSLSTVAQGAWGLVLARVSGRSEALMGVTVRGRADTVEGADRMIGVCINTVPFRVPVPDAETVRTWLRTLREDQLRIRPHDHASLVEIQRWSPLPSGVPLFESLLVYDHMTYRSTLDALGVGGETRSFRLEERTGFPLSLNVFGEDPIRVRLVYDRRRYDDAFAAALVDGLVHVLEEVAADPGRPLGGIGLVTPQAFRRQVEEWNDTAVDVEPDRVIHELVTEQARRTPDRVALSCGTRKLTYRELHERSNRLARHLASLGVRPDEPVGVLLERSPEVVVAVLAILKAGAAYLPLDPEHPRNRLAFMISDARPAALVTTSGLEERFQDVEVPVVRLDTDAGPIEEEAAGDLEPAAGPGDLAYVIYTSGSTGTPKGVMVEHRNVVNFFAGMDARVGGERPGVWLSVTTLGFDISVLELLWTLSRGFEVVLPESAGAAGGSRRGDAGMELSLFYFSGQQPEDPEERYRLLMDGALYADRNGFSAVWTPERHFHAFGGLYPNPAVLGAALAAVTERVAIRSGSVVLPLHHPIRVVEEWSVVDNLSGGRVGLSFASGWHPEDFVLAPDNYEDRKEVMARGVDTVRRLWRGESVDFPGADGEPVEVRTLPRPVQEELPVWITTAGSPDTFRTAGETGANVLTHLLGQSPDELAEKIGLYREARTAAGHAGPGRVSLMLHTFVAEDDDEARETVREPMKAYLRTAVGLIKNFAKAWLPPGKKGRPADVKGGEFQNLSEEDMDSLLDFAFERYYETSGLMGSRERCTAMLERLEAAGVDEIACLIDFGVDTDVTLRHLEDLKGLWDAAPPTADGGVAGFAEAVQRRGVTHLQCTPSQARLFLADREAREALGRISTILLGGEACPWSLVRELREVTGASVTNMYGPTETTIWSSTYDVGEPGGDGSATVPIGTPIANTRFYVLDPARRPVPAGAPGELWIAGDGVARGYLRRPELTEERFVRDPFAGNGDRMYGTGDLVRYRSDGCLEFLGRIDDQVKIRGHRVELGEIEAVLEEHPDVEAAAAAVDDASGDGRLEAFVVAVDPARPPDGAELVARARERLPEVMVPRGVTVLDALPLTPNRKLDRRGLMERAPLREEAGSRPPGTPVEEELARIWGDVLGVERVAADDDFFELGANSLSTVQISSRVREALGVDLPLRTFFELRTIEELARHVEEVALAETDDAELARLLSEVES